MKVSIVSRGHGFYPGGVFDICPTIFCGQWHFDNLLVILYED